MMCRQVSYKAASCHLQVLTSGGQPRTGQLEAISVPTWMIRFQVSKLAASELKNLDIPDSSVHFCVFLESKIQKQLDKFGQCAEQPVFLGAG